MYRPTTRLLTILELLQSRGVVGGAELARRLEVEPRSVRRYVQMLDELGIPIEAIRGPGGGYRLRPGYKLPPLMFTEAEATAIALGLLGSTWLQIGQSPVAIEGALAKLTRVLPERAREQLVALSANLVLSPLEQEARPDAALVIRLGEAVQRRQRVAIAYSSASGETQRTVEPYGLAGWWGRWYLVAWCCLRQDYRSFRLDRMGTVEVLRETFEPDPAFAYEAYVRDQMEGRSSGVRAVLDFDAPETEVRKFFSPERAEVTATATAVRCVTWGSDVWGVARFLLGIGLPFVVIEPAELRATLRTLAERASHAAGELQAGASSTL